ncbi:MAG: TonB-dependent receptor [Epsilonproteobacteria bacterium]|nr:TonB-dependent receptor [Campylobacterota bacterium]
MTWRLLMTGMAFPFFLKAQTNLFDLSLEDLSQIKVDNRFATLTRSGTRETPANVTVITHEQIVESGARNLDELLEIFVPSFAYMYKVHGSQMGIGGIISDRNNKILLLVNGRNMNVKATDGGAITERWTGTLDDIDEISVISGPGSAVFGPGAIAGVINIKTFNGHTFHGTQTRLKGTLGAQAFSAEIQHGEQLSDDLALYAYYGVEQASGADDDLAPHKVAFNMTIDRPAYNDTTVFEADKDFPFKTTPDMASFHSSPRHKIHLQLDTENLSVWGRYTQSGQASPTLQNLYGFSYHRYGDQYPEIFQDTGNAHRQWTLYAQYRHIINDEWSVESSASYMQSDIKTVTLHTDNGTKEWKEKDLNLNTVVRYRPFPVHAFALGISYDDTEFDPSKAPTAYKSLFQSHSHWYAGLFSLYGEYQGNMTDQITLFTGFRLDKHRFSPWMFAPRFALIYLPTPEDAIKLIYNQSVRHSDDADLYAIHVTTGEDGDIEKIDRTELIVEHRFSPHHKLFFDAYYTHHHVVAYNQLTLIQESIGTLDFFGLEAKYSFNFDKLDGFLSHCYTKQLDFTLDDPTLQYQNISASPYGYGNDLANWHDHITKASVTYHASPRFSYTGSLRIFWGLPGAVDMADYNKEVLDGTLLLPLYDESKTAFGTSAFLDLGFHYKWSEKLDISVFGYDLLGLFDEDINKRNFFQRTSQYRDTAPSLSLQLHYQF